MIRPSLVGEMLAVLAEVTTDFCKVTFGRIVHGDNFHSLRINVQSVFVKRGLEFFTEVGHHCPQFRSAFNRRHLVNVLGVVRFLRHQRLDFVND